jgi:hypothetical protein
VPLPCGKVGELLVEDHLPAQLTLCFVSCRW